jgi:hypothetical protein
MAYFCQQVQASNNIQSAFIALSQSLKDLPEELIHNIIGQ